MKASVKLQQQYNFTHTKKNMKILFYFHLKSEQLTESLIKSQNDKASKINRYDFVLFNGIVKVHMLCMCTIRI